MKYAVLLISIQNYVGRIRSEDDRSPVLSPQIASVLGSRFSAPAKITGAKFSPPNSYRVPPILEHHSAKNHVTRAILCLSEKLNNFTWYYKCIEKKKPLNT